MRPITRHTRLPPHQRVAPEVRREIRLVAIDLDGTLLDDSKRISAHTLSALRQVLRRGIALVIASARPPRSVRSIYKQLDLNTPQINYNGAMIWDERRRRAVFHRPMQPGLVRGIVRAARARFPRALVSCEILDRWCTDRDHPRYTTETGKLFRPDVLAPVDSFLTCPVTKLMLLGPRRWMGALHAELGERFGARVTVMHTDPHLLQIMHRSAGKAQALRTVARGMGISMRQVLAIGDAPNDAGMIEAAGVGVAMGNAHRSVKAVADWVAPSNNDHGVHAALARFGLIR